MYHMKVYHFGMSPGAPSLRGQDIRRISGWFSCMDSCRSWTASVRNCSLRRLKICYN